MNFNFRMTRMSLELIRDLNETLETDETRKISKGKVEKTMQRVIDTVEKHRQEKLEQKENR